MKDGKLTFEDIDRARKVLELGESATLSELKKAYRGLSKKWHPDTLSGKDKDVNEAKMKQINKSYKILLKYIENYCYSFKEEKAGEDDLGKYWEKRFGKGPGWDL
jgi:DnaJ-class molecular chaperone